MIATETDDVAAAQKRASRIGARAQIEEVRLMSSNAVLLRIAGHGAKLTYNFEKDFSVTHYEDDPYFVISGHYRLDIRELDEFSGDEVDVSVAKDFEEADPVADIAFEFSALFSLSFRPDDAPIVEDELESYATTTGAFALHPYARQYVSQLVGHLGLPPLTLPVLRLPTTPPPDTDD